MNLAGRLRAALAEALPVAELEAIKNGQDRATRRFLRAEISQEEYDRELLPFLNLRGAVEVETPDEFKEALGWVGLPAEEVQELLDHELAHFTEDRAQGLDPSFMIQFFRHPDGRLGLYPSVKSGLAGSTDEEKRTLLRRSLEAPEQLSPRDLSQLEDSE